MKFSTIEEIHESLKRNKEIAEAAVNKLTADNEPQYADYWRLKLAKASEALEDFASQLDDSNRCYHEAEELKKHLLTCEYHPGATIKITVKSDDGRKTTARLYDHAALVQSLYDALEYFQSEL